MKCARCGYDISPNDAECPFCSGKSVPPHETASEKENLDRNVPPRFTGANCGCSGCGCLGMLLFLLLAVFSPLLRLTRRAR